MGISTLGQLLLLLRKGGLVERPLRDSFLARVVGSSITVEPRVGLMLSDDAKVFASEEGENRGENRGLEEVLNRGLIGTEYGVVFVTMGGIRAGTEPKTGADAAGARSAVKTVPSYSESSTISVMGLERGGTLSLRPLSTSRLLYRAIRCGLLSRSSGAMCSNDI